MKSAPILYDGAHIFQDWDWNHQQKKVLADDRNNHGFGQNTFLGTNISHHKAFLKMIFLSPRWDMSVRVIPTQPGSNKNDGLAVNVPRGISAELPIAASRGGGGDIRYFECIV